MWSFLHQLIMFLQRCSRHWSRKSLVSLMNLADICLHLSYLTMILYYQEDVWKVMMHVYNCIWWGHIKSRYEYKKMLLWKFSKHVSAVLLEIIVSQMSYITLLQALLSSYRDQFGVMQKDLHNARWSWKIIFSNFD